MKQIYTFGNYLKNKYACRVYKVGINISGLTCPNIDGTVAKGGCTFCENDSFSASTGETRELKGFHLNLDSKENPFLEKQLQQLEIQFDSISQRQQQEYGAEKFLVYFQSFTNTYAPFETLKALTDNTVKIAEFVKRFGAKGEGIKKAVQIAKAYLTAAILKAENINIGQGYGPTNHSQGFNVDVSLDLVTIKED